MSSERTGITFPYEKDAMMMREMPDGIDFPDKVMYLSLRLLYSHFKNGMIGEQQAISEKRKLIKDYDLLRFEYDTSMRWVKCLHQLEASATDFRKNRTIENANKMLTALDGIE